MLLPLCFLAAVLAGAVWGAIPGVLKARFGSHEVINTIMLNFVAVALVSYFTQYHYKMPGDPIMQTHDDRRAAPTFPGSAASFPASRSGFRSISRSCSRWWRACWCICFCGGRSGATRFARPAAIRRRRSTAASRFAGRLCWRWRCPARSRAWSAINEVLGYRYRYYDGFSANYGFTGIAVALLGRNHPVGVLLAAGAVRR